MNKNFEKIAIVAQICIGVIFVLFVIFIPLGVLEVGLFDNSLVKILLGILTTLFIALSTYILISTFSSNGALKKLLLFSDSESKTLTSAKVIKKLVVREGRKVDGIIVKKVAITQDDKYGFKLRVTVAITNNDVEESVDTLRCMIADSFYNGLGVRFNSIDFVVKNLRTKYVADLEEAQKQAKLLKGRRNCSKTYIHDPLDSIYANEQAHSEPDGAKAASAESFDNESVGDEISESADIDDNNHTGLNVQRESVNEDNENDGNQNDKKTETVVNIEDAEHAELNTDDKNLEIDI